MSHFPEEARGFWGLPKLAMAKRPLLMHTPSREQGLVPPGQWGAPPHCRDL